MRRLRRHADRSIRYVGRGEQGRGDEHGPDRRRPRQADAAVHDVLAGPRAVPGRQLRAGRRGGRRATGLRLRPPPRAATGGAGRAGRLHRGARRLRAEGLRRRAGPSDALARWKRPAAGGSRHGVGGRQARRRRSGDGRERPRSRDHRAHAPGGASQGDGRRSARHRSDRHVREGDQRARCHRRHHHARSDDPEGQQPQGRRRCGAAPAQRGRRGRDRPSRA